MRLLRWQAGDVEGFAAVAFPIVRRVFGGLIANELVSVQPMSLPSGLIFFLDFTFADTKLSVRVANDSLYGGGVVRSTAYWWCYTWDSTDATSEFLDFQS